MVDKKITELTALTELTPTDLVLVVDDVSGTATSKKVAVSVLDDRYEPPATYSADAITESATKKVMTSAERTKLAALNPATSNDYTLLGLILAL